MLSLPRSTACRLPTRRSQAGAVIATALFLRRGHGDVAPGLIHRADEVGGRTIVFRAAQAPTTTIDGPSRILPRPVRTRAPSGVPA